MDLFSVICRKGSTFKKTYLKYTFFSQTRNLAHRKVRNSRIAVLRYIDDSACRTTIHLVTYSPGSTLIRVTCNNNTKPVVFHGLIAVSHEHAPARKDGKQFHMKKLVSFFDQQFKSALRGSQIKCTMCYSTQTTANPSYLRTDTPLFNFWFVLCDKDLKKGERRSFKKHKQTRREQHERKYKMRVECGWIEIMWKEVLWKKGFQNNLQESPLKVQWQREKWKISKMPVGKSCPILVYLRGIDQD